jgi:hypothetical protein
VYLRTGFAHADVEAAPEAVENIGMSVVLCVQKGHKHINTTDKNFIG